MAAITFVDISNNRVSVRLDGMTVGYIERRVGGWRYVPKGGKSYAGDVFPTLAACKRSVTGEEPLAPIA